MVFVYANGAVVEHAIEHGQIPPWWDAAVGAAIAAFDKAVQDHLIKKHAR